MAEGEENVPPSRRYRLHSVNVRSLPAGRFLAALLGVPAEQYLNIPMIREIGENIIQPIGNSPPDNSTIYVGAPFLQVQMTVVTALFMLPTAVFFPMLLRVANTPPTSVTLRRRDDCECSTTLTKPHNDAYDQEGDSLDGGGNIFFNNRDGKLLQTVPSGECRDAAPYTDANNTLWLSPFCVP